MLSVNEAISCIEKFCPLLESEVVELAEARNRYHAQDIIAPYDLPLFDNSAMDGFAISKQDLVQPGADTISLSVIATSLAGGKTEELRKGQAVKIMTGAPVPKNTGAVIMLENVDDQGDIIHIKAEHFPRKKENIRFRGEEIQQNNLISHIGRFIGSRDIGFLANCGIGKVAVRKRPQISLLVTGDELVALGEELRPGKIFDSNSYLLSSSLARLDLPVSICRVKDDKKLLKASLVSAFETSEVTLVTGGVSVGSRDYTKEILKDLGFGNGFWRVAQKPGKPLFFGINGNRTVFGLPGNPVSAWFGLFYYVMPYLRQMQGAKEWRPSLMIGKWDGPPVSRGLRTSFARCYWQVKEMSIVVSALRGQGSHMLQDLAGANCLVRIDPGIRPLEPGDPVTVHPL